MSIMSLLTTVLQRQLVVMCWWNVTQGYNDGNVDEENRNPEQYCLIWSEAVDIRKNLINDQVNYQPWEVFNGL